MKLKAPAMLGQRVGFVNQLLIKNATWRIIARAESIRIEVKAVSQTFSQPTQLELTPSLSCAGPLVAQNGDALAIATIRPVVPNRMMLGATIVPQGQRIGLPLYATGEPVGSGDVIEQRAKQRLALPTTHALNV